MKRKNIGFIIGAIVLVILVVLFILDYNDLLNGHKLNMEFWAMIGLNIVTIALFVITFDCIEFEPIFEIKSPVSELELISLLAILISSPALSTLIPLTPLFLTVLYVMWMFSQALLLTLSLSEISMPSNLLDKISLL